MSNNHRTPRPAPRALCAAFATLLPLLSLDALDRDEAEAVEAHVRTCDFCQREVADYRTLRDAILREDARDAAEGNAPPLLTLAAVRNVADREEAEPLVFDTPPPRWERPASHTWRRWRAARAFEALAAVLVIALIGGLLMGRHFVGPGSVPILGIATPRATVDPVSQAYVSMLRRYYVPLVQAYIPARDCDRSVTAAATQTPAPPLESCRAPIQAELTAAQALSAHLASATPPARWQGQHTALQQATDSITTTTTTLLQAIDTHNLGLFVTVRSAPDEGQFCAPIAKINTGPPKLTPLLPYLEPSLCLP